MVDIYRKSATFCMWCKFEENCFYLLSKSVTYLEDKNSGFVFCRQKEINWLRKWAVILRKYRICFLYSILFLLHILYIFSTFNVFCLIWKLYYMPSIFLLLTSSEGPWNSSNKNSLSWVQRLRPIHHKVTVT